MTHGTKETLIFGLIMVVGVLACVALICMELGR